MNRLDGLYILNLDEKIFNRKDDYMRYRREFKEGRGMKVHELKIYSKYFIDIASGIKNFEIRKNDRDFKKGDFLHLKEVENETTNYTGFGMFVKVDYIHEGLGMQEGYVCMAIHRIEMS